MKKSLLLIAVLGVAASSVFASPDPKKIKCAVMTGSEVDIAKATKAKMYADYKGRRYFFCCKGCPEAFKKNPAAFAKHASIPVPKKKKA
jgi:YHS domain-containing protein